MSPARKGKEVPDKNAFPIDPLQSLIGEKVELKLKGDESTKICELFSVDPNSGGIVVLQVKQNISSSPYQFVPGSMIDYVKRHEQRQTDNENIFYRPSLNKIDFDDLEFAVGHPVKVTLARLANEDASAITGNLFCFDAASGSVGLARYCDNNHDPKRFVIVPRAQIANITRQVQSDSSCRPYSADFEGTVERCLGKREKDERIGSPTPDRTNEQSRREFSGSPTRKEKKPSGCELTPLLADMKLVVLVALVAGAVAQHCNTGGIYNEQFNRCYQYFTAPAEFEFADEQCSNLGGHLASVTNGQENALINANAAQAFQKSNYTDFWIGANDLATPGQWQWTDGSNFAYSNWGPSQPQDGSDCATQQVSDGSWSTLGCTVYRPYVCVTPPLLISTCPPQTTPVPTTCPTPPPCTQRTCVPSCEIEWTYFPITDMCYKTFFGMKWDDAEAFCVGQHGHLTSIHTEAENTFVANMAKTGVKEGNPKDLCWIGMHKVNNDWVWTDGTKSDYFNWAPKQPDNPNKEFCVETAPDLSHDKWFENWNNEECNTVMRAFICKKNSIH
ncbi:unnamed protein product [Caenorhabditis auriculariae]|uniref:C-type lectin domain-containing protein n=1 Tax=Caenorhabditis auriculariae TaxID=2777116 RepID=A0A8S1HA42_9PELO|nr:unnamed protein product [Caenorhabditis auriculariae]